MIKAWNDIKDRADDTSPDQGGEFETKVALTDNIPFRFVLTHATQDEDTQLQRQIAATPRTYILGGHDHDIQYVDYSGTIFIGKNLSNAETIRVMLPLAGGRSACNEVYAAYQRLQKRQRNKRFLYPQDLEAVLLTVSDLDSDVLRERIQEQNPAEGSELKDVLNKARCEYDIPAFELTYEDHDMSDVAADEIIQAAIAKVELSDDDKLVRNFTGITALEARDHYIRKDATNMGVLVAECVRREAEAQLNQKGHRPAGAPAPVIALINSGAFRCDSELKPELKLRDLRETFLYDDDKAIMVLKVSAEVVRELVKHGTQETKKGTGAYPQLAGGWKTAKGDVWLAISSFLLIRADNNDGYNEVLQKFWKLPDAEATAEKALKEASDVRFSITDAVKNNAQAVPANKLPKQARKTVKGEAEILRLLQAYLKAFHENISPDDSNFPNKETWLESKVPIDQPAIREARDAVRGFLEERGTVKKYKDVAATLNKGAQWKDDARVAWTNARKELLELRGSLRSQDDPAFSTGDSYFRLFNAAVRGIPGWGLLPALT
ncbi:hypothetical protein A5764_25690 [Mycobacterium sp. 852002-51057_SCH5723018]|nr:hypothetical protein A5764_25690 [Mycobacterium sp. 852002-51057_SCH5723018]